MRGDLNALTRIEKNDRRADRLQRRLNRILRKKEKNESVAAVSAVQFEQFCAWYSEASRDMAERYRHRLSTLTGTDGKKVFYVSDFDSARGIVVCARDATMGICTEMAASVLGGGLQSWPCTRGLLKILLADQPVGGFVPASSDDNTNINAIVFRPDSSTPLLFVCGDTPLGCVCDDFCTPRAAQLDEAAVKSLQHALVKMLNLRPLETRA